MKDYLSGIMNAFNYGAVKHWTPATTPPTESDRYWCYVKELTDLGWSYYEGNFYYSAEEDRWSTSNGEIITHWTTLMGRPELLL